METFWSVIVGFVVVFLVVGLFIGNIVLSAIASPWLLVASVPVSILIIATVMQMAVNIMSNLD